MEKHNEWTVEEGDVRNDRRGRLSSDQRWKKLMLNMMWMMAEQNEWTVDEGEVWNDRRGEREGVK